MKDEDILGDGFHEVEVEEDEVESEKGLPAVDEEKSTISMVGLNCPLKAKKAIKDFFAELHWAIGGKIPENILLKDKYLNLIRNIEFNDAIDACYSLINKHAQHSGFFARSGPYVEDLEISMCLYVVHRAGELHIPQGYIGGIFLIYLELCEGVKLL